ncbi:MAG: VWA domain-containing protein [Planctomycetota bacterium]
MNVSCIHCGKLFSITADQLGKRGKCPHCREQIKLPRRERRFAYLEERISPPRRTLEHMMCGFTALIMHLLVLIVIALMPWGDFSDGYEGDGEQILIGHLSQEKLVNNPTDELTRMEIDNPNDFQPLDIMQTELFADASENPLSNNPLDISLPAMSGGARQSFEVRSIDQGDPLAGGSEAFGKMVDRLKRDGLDIVICFDSTGSMGGEIEEVKGRIQRIGDVLLQMIPKARISICTYRDHGDTYLVKGESLTDDIARIVDFLDTVEADGGGDNPEAVHQGLQWAIERNDFRPRARKVILLFGDAPPHPDKSVTCQSLASDFRKGGGIVSTVTCRSEEILPEFEAIARIGAGEAFLTSNEREIMTQLMVLVFGSRHRTKVLEAFDLLEN